MGSLADEDRSGQPATAKSPDSVAIVEYNAERRSTLHICRDTECFKYRNGCSKNNFEQKNLSGNSVVFGFHTGNNGAKGC